MGGKRASKSELFLMELIFSILFFSIASAVCVTLFVHARLTSVESTQLTQLPFRHNLPQKPLSL